MFQEIQWSTYNGEQAIRLTGGSYQAVVLPSIGANCISLRETTRNLAILREPALADMEAFKAFPTTYGIPVLFPPNRYDHGTFTLLDQTYHFPINERDKDNHLHGFLHNVPWSVTASGQSDSASFVVLTVHVTKDHPVYKYFPHDFSMTVEYRLSDAGLQQLVTVQNHGTQPMPCMLAFHTAINVPFAEGSQATDCRFTATIGKRWVLDERMLPTGAYQALSATEQQMRGEGIYPFFEPMDNHYTAEAVANQNFVAVTDERQGLRLMYDVGTKYRNWMIWNNRGNGEFICPEPQVNLINAPNTHLTPTEAGLVILHEGEVWSETSRLYVEDVQA